MNQLLVNVLQQLDGPVCATPASRLPCLQITISMCRPIIVLPQPQRLSIRSARLAAASPAAAREPSNLKERRAQWEGSARARGGASADQWQSVPRRSLFSCHRGADWSLWGGTLQPKTRAAHESPINFVPIQIIFSSSRSAMQRRRRSCRAAHARDGGELPWFRRGTSCEGGRT